MLNNNNRIPQGSIFGPFLFILYINDLPTVKSTHMSIYANDTAVYASSWCPDKATYVQNQLDTLTDYLKNWKLTINPKKTKAISFIIKRNIILKPITIAGHNILWTTIVKYLRDILDSEIIWALAID